jgi:hypothetical protein
MTSTAQTRHDTICRVRSAVDLLIDRETLEFGSLAVSGDGRLQLVGKGSPLSFTLINRGLHLRCLWRTEPKATLLVEANLGKLPYSIEASTGRSKIKRLIEATATGRRWRFALNDEQDMRLEAALVPPAPHTLVSVVAALVSFILEVRPYTDLMGEMLGRQRL